LYRAISCLVLVSAVLVGCGSSGPQPARSVIFVTIDTLRADVLEIYGGPARVPALRELAERGWVWESCFSTSMLTTPSHVSLMTSLYPRDHGVYNNRTGVADGVMTLAQVFRAAGFRTGAVPSFRHLTPESSNLGHGFEHFAELTAPSRTGKAATKRALAWLDQVSKGERFFLWVHYVEPHWPYRADPVGDLKDWPAVQAKPMRDAKAAAPRSKLMDPAFQRTAKAYATTEPVLRRYIGEVERVDGYLQDLRNGVRARGLEGGTLWVVTSDHGENLGEHELYFHHGGLYDATTRVPLIMAGPGLRPQRPTGLTSSVDVAPTILSLSGVDPWSPMSGRSLVTEEGEAALARTYVYSEHERAVQVAVRSEDGTFILDRKTYKKFPTLKMVEGRWELYERREDPGEIHPIVDGDRAAKLRSVVETFLDEGQQLTPRPATSVDEEALRALGYVE